MKNLIKSIFVLAIAFSLFSFNLPDDKVVSKKSNISFFSHTALEDIEAKNTASVSTLNKVTGDVVFSVPMQGFEFEKALMQKHFNSSKFLDTKKFPKAKLKAKITNISDIDFSKDGTYIAKVKGDLTIKGVKIEISEQGSIIIKGEKIELKSKFNVTLADFGITFAKGKPASNVAKTLEISVQAVY